MRQRQPIKPGETSRRVQPKLNAWLLEGIDEEATALGISREDLIKVWLAERLRLEQSRKKDADKRKKKPEQPEHPVEKSA